MTVRKADCIEVYPWLRRAKGAKASAKAVLVGYRFRFFKAGTEEPMLVSEGIYESAARATEVAGKLNTLCFAGHYKVRRRAA